jgi:hypothetical protein
MPKSELAQFFCDEEVKWGQKGDYEGWSTERAAIELIRYLRAALREAPPQTEGV